MLMPNKYLTLSESCIGISSMLLDCISKNSITIEVLWDKFVNKYSKKLGEKAPDFQKFVFSVEFMYMSGMISYTETGEIYNENFKAKD